MELMDEVFNKLAESKQAHDSKEKETAIGSSFVVQQLLTEEETLYMQWGRGGVFEKEEVREATEGFFLLFSFLFSNFGERVVQLSASNQTKIIPLNKKMHVKLPM